MELNKNLQNLMNEQIKHELYSAYLYLSMSAYCESINMPGFAHWFRVQSEEEVEHAMKFFAYVNERGGRVFLGAIDEPPAEFSSVVEVAEQTYEHEQKVSELINEIYAVALAEDDYAAQVFLHWFVEEQVEEEDNTRTLVEQLRMIGDHTSTLFMLDRQLGAREE